MNLINGPCAVELFSINEEYPHESRLLSRSAYDPDSDHLEDMRGPSFWLYGVSMGQHWPLIAAPAQPEPQRWVGSLLVMPASVVTVRKINPDDAWLALGRQCPIPLDLMEAIAMRAAGAPGVIEALTEDDGYVVTLMLQSELGLYLRFAGAWWLQPAGQDPDFIDGLTVVDVADEAVDIYDVADQAGMQLTADALPLAEGETLDGLEIIPRTNGNDPSEVAIAAAAMILSSPMPGDIAPIRTRDDVPPAIQAAASDPGQRWYVEKRIKALGLESEFTLPWVTVTTP